MGMLGWCKRGGCPMSRAFRDPCLLSERPTHSADEAGFIIEHCKAEFLATGRNVHVDRYHPAVVNNLLISCGVEGFVHLNAAGPQILAVQAPDTGVETHIHLLAAAGGFRLQSMGIHQEHDPNLAWVSGLRLRHE